MLQSRTRGPVDQALVLDESHIEVPAAESGQRQESLASCTRTCTPGARCSRSRIAGTTSRVITEENAPMFTVPLSRSDMA